MKEGQFHDYPMRGVLGGRGRGAKAWIGKELELTMIWFSKQSNDLFPTGQRPGVDHTKTLCI